MRNTVLGFLAFFVLFIASCVVDPGVDDSCIADNTGDLTIENSTSGVDGVPLDIYINGNGPVETLSPGAQRYEGALAVGDYTVEGIDPNGTVAFLKEVTLLQCDDLFVRLGN